MYTAGNAKTVNENRNTLSWLMTTHITEAWLSEGVRVDESAGGQQGGLEAK